MCSAGSGGSGIKGDSIGEPARTASAPRTGTISATDGEADTARKDRSSWAVTLPAESHIERLDRDTITAVGIGR